MLAGFRNKPVVGNTIACLALFVALGGTSYATISERGGGKDRQGSRAVKDSPPPMAPSTSTAAGTVLDTSYVYQYQAVTLPGAPPQWSQVNLGSTADGQSGGYVDFAQHGEMHVSARVVVRKSSPGAGGMASCDIRVSGVAFTSASNVTFSDAGTDAAGNPALPTETLYIEANGVISAGRYNVGVRCWTDRPNLAQMSDVELSVKVFNAS